MTSPFPTSKEASDPVYTEMYRLGLELGMPSRNMTIDNRTFKLTPVQYDEYVRRAGTRAYERVSAIAGYDVPDVRKAQRFEYEVREARRIEGERFKRELQSSGAIAEEQWKKD
jgi:hypothetical protein